MAAWLKQQHEREIHSLSALRNRLRSKDSNEIQAAVKLATQFQEEAVPVRRGSKHNQFPAILAALSQPVHSQPLRLLPVKISRQTERLIHEYQTAASKQKVKAGTLSPYVDCLRKFSLWIEERASSINIDSLEKLLHVKEEEKAHVTELIKAAKEDCPTDVVMKKLLNAAVKSFQEVMRQQRSTLAELENMLFNDKAENALLTDEACILATEAELHDLLSDNFGDLAETSLSSEAQAFQPLPPPVTGRNADSETRQVHPRLEGNMPTQTALQRQLLRAARPLAQRDHDAGS